MSCSSIPPASWRPPGPRQRRISSGVRPRTTPYPAANRTAIYQWLGANKLHLPWKERLLGRFSPTVGRLLGLAQGNEANQAKYRAYIDLMLDLRVQSRAEKVGRDLILVLPLAKELQEINITGFLDKVQAEPEFLEELSWNCVRDPYEYLNLRALVRLNNMYFSKKSFGDSFDGDIFNKGR